MALEFHKTEVEGIVIIKPHSFEDERGTYLKGYEKDYYFDNGITCDFREASEIYSKKGVLRGLHYQTKFSQAKLIHVISGKIFDVALDLRKDSITYGKFHAEIIDGNIPKFIFIPEGFAHGFLSLTEDTIFSYQCSGKYLPEYSEGVRWDDPKIGIPWPLKEFSIDSLIISEKDRNWPFLRQ